MNAARSFAEDPRIAEAKTRDWDQLVANLAIGRLQRAGVERIGPCPSCGGTDRFGINTRKGVFQCRRCEAKGDQIALVQLVLGLDFPAALAWICGPRQELTPAQRAERADRDAANLARKQAEEAKFREKAIADARAIWNAAVPAEGTPVRDYLALRGITRDLLPSLPPTLRYHPDLAYMVQGQGGRWIEAHRGPAIAPGLTWPPRKANCGSCILKPVPPRRARNPGGRKRAASSVCRRASAPRW